MNQPANVIKFVISESNGEFILPYQNYPTSGQTTGMFSSITLTKKREKEVVCFNYRYQGIQGKVNFSVSEINVNTNVITKRFNPNFLSEVQTRHCFMISNSLSEGYQYQVNKEIKSTLCGGKNNR